MTAIVLTIYVCGAAATVPFVWVGLIRDHVRRFPNVGWNGTYTGYSAFISVCAGLLWPAVVVVMLVGPKIHRAAARVAQREREDRR